MLRISVFSGYLYFCNSYVVQNGFWAVFIVKSQAICILCHIACEVLLSVCHKPCLIYVKSWQKLRTMNLVKEQNKFRQYLLPFSSECCMYWYIKLTLFLSFCVGVKFGVLHQEKKTDWGCVEQGGEGNIWCGREVGIEGCRRLCKELCDWYSSPHIIIIVAMKIIHMWHVACI